MYTHEVNLNCDYIVAVTKDLVATGELMSVKNTPFDFTNGFTKIGKGVNCIKHEQIERGGGFDHTLVINRAKNEFCLFLRKKLVQ